MNAASPPLAIAMISNYLPSGSKIGVGYQAHALANELAGRGHEVTIFSACGPSEGANYRTVTIPLSGSNRTFKFALALRHVDFSRFDVLHAHGDDYWLWRRRAGAHVRTMHGSCLSEARWVQGSRARIRMLALGLSEILATAVADKTIAVSENTRRWLPWVRSVIPNGVDLAQFHARERSATPTVLFVGTYLNRKRGKLLADAFARDVRPAIPDAELWMVCSDAPAADGVRVLGRLSEDELAERYGQAWVFCLPSTYEGFGIPYIEAMASGCPVVATANPGAIEVTDHGRFGVITDEQALGTTLARLLSSPEERAQLAQASLSRVSHYDLVSVADRYEAVYRRLLERAGAARSGERRGARRRAEVVSPALVVDTDSDPFDGD